MSTRILSPDQITPNFTSLNVSSNIANVGNLLVTQNTVSGNISITTLANVATLNVSSNIANVGNLLVTQNTFTGNISITTLANVTTLNVSSNIANVGNLFVTQNVTAGNGTFSGSVMITGNLTVIGTTTTINSSSLQTSNQYLLLTANNQVSDLLDYGFAGLAHNAAVGNSWAGLIKHTTDEIWYLFDGFAQTATVTLNTATLNIAQTNVATMNANLIAPLINVFTLNVSSNISSGNLSVTQNASFGNITTANLVVTNPIGLYANSVSNTLPTTQNNWFPTGLTTNTNLILVTVPSGNANVTGISNTGIVPGLPYMIFNTSVTDSIIFINKSGNSTSGNQLSCPGNTNGTLGPQYSTIIVYSTVLNKWIFN